MIVWRPLRGLAWRLLPQAKAGVAAGLSWWLSQLLFGSRQPYFAPLAAILTMQVTVSDSVTFGGQRILGVIGGVAVSLAAAHWLRPSALGVALLVFVGMGIASVVGLANLAVAQVGISGLLVLALGNRPEYAAARLVETVLGALIAVLVQAFLVPQDPIPAARNAVAALAAEIAAMLRHLSDHDKAVDPAQLGRQAEAAQEAVGLARRSLRYSPLLRRRRREASDLRAAIDALEVAADAARGIAASLGALREQGGAAAAVPALVSAADAVGALGEYVEHPSAQGAARFAAAARRLLRAGQLGLRLLSAPRRAEARRQIGAVLWELERLRRGLGRARRRLGRA